MYEDFNKWQNQIEYQPYINHLDVGCFRQGVGYADEHGHQYEQDSQINSNNSFKEERFEEVCRMPNDIQKNGREENSKKIAK